MAGKIEGMAEAFNNLMSLKSVATQKNALRRSLMPAANMYRDKMEELAPEFEGNLKASIHIEEKPKLSKSQAKAKRKGGDKSVEVHVIADDAAAARQEYGTSFHPPQPFGIPAYDATRQGMLDVTAEAAKKEIGSAVERQARKAARG